MKFRSILFWLFNFCLLRQGDESSVSKWIRLVGKVPVKKKEKSRSLCLCPAVYNLFFMHVLFQHSRRADSQAPALSTYRSDGRYPISIFPIFYFFSFFYFFFYFWCRDIINSPPSIYFFLFLTYSKEPIETGRAADQQKNPNNNTTLLWL